MNDTKPVPEKTIALYEKLIATIPDLERKGATMPYTSRNGHMFSFLTKEGRLALRLPEEVREAFLKEHKARLCEQHGKVLTEYVVVPAALLKNMKQLQKSFRISYDYTGTLKPKATVKKK